MGALNNLNCNIMRNLWLSILFYKDDGSIKHNYTLLQDIIIAITYVLVV